VVEQAFHSGFRFDECEFSSEQSIDVEVNTAIFVVGWEDRSITLLKSGVVRGKKCILLRFEDDEIEEQTQSEFERLANKSFESVETVELRSVYKVQELMSDAEKLVSDSFKSNGLCAVDYSSMPGILTQTLFRRFMINGNCPRVNWLYSIAVYDETPCIEADYHQGLDDFYSVRGAEGVGLNARKIAILSLGADLALSRRFLARDSYDLVYYVYSDYPGSPALTEKLQTQIDLMMKDPAIENRMIVKSSPNLIIPALSELNDIMSHHPDENSSVEIFCNGPKSHALAAATLVSQFNHVRLVGRVPESYKRYNVPASGKFTSTTITDFTNPAIIEILTNSEQST
jgi:hypothetical protein